MKSFFRMLPAAATLLLLFLAWPARPAAAAVTINVTYTDDADEGFNDATLGLARRTAFEAAVDFWGGRLTSGVPIEINAHFDSLGNRNGLATLASGGPNSITHDWTKSASPFKSKTWYPIALANKLAGRDLEPESADIDIACNSNIDGPSALGSTSFYYGLDGNPGSDIDFYSVIVHEMQHGMGIVSYLASDGSFLSITQPNIYERFLQSGPDGHPVSLTSMSLTERAAAIVSGQLFFNGTQTVAANGGPAKVYAPSTFSRGSSVMHLDEATFSGINECMTPKRNGTVHDPGPVATGMLRDMGWSVADSDSTPPEVTCAYPVAGLLNSLNQAGAGTINNPPGSDTALLPRVEVRLKRNSNSQWWSGTKWSTTSATTIEGSPKMPSTYNSTILTSATWSVAQSAWPASRLLYDREDYTLYVTAFDTAGNKTTLTRAFRIDSKPPVVAWAPLQNSSLVNDFATLGGSISEASSVSFQIVEVNAPLATPPVPDRFWTGLTWSTDAATPFQPGAISGSTWNRGTSILPTATEVRSGPYRLTVRAANASGTVVESTITPTVTTGDITRPTVTIASPVSSKAVNTLTIISGTVADNPGGSGILKVRVFLRRVADANFWTGQTWVSTASEALAVLGTNSLGETTWRITSLLPQNADLVDGAYYVAAIPRDNAGNNGPAVGSQFILDRAAPAATIMVPADGATVSALPTITATATDTLTGGAAGSGVVSVRMTLQRQSDSLFWNGLTWVPGDMAPPAFSAPFTAGNWTRSTGLPRGIRLVPGAYAIAATVLDRAGNSTIATSTFTVASGVPLASASPVVLSSATATSDGSIHLVFTGALRPSAANTANYSLTQNGLVVGVNSAQHPTANEAVLNCGSLTTGSRVTVTYHLQDPQGRTVMGTTTVIVKFS